MKKLIIFDMDGVLIDACDWHRDALNIALKKICNYEIPLDDHYKIYNGLPTKVKLKKLSDLGFIDKNNFEEIENLKQEETINIIREKAQKDNSKIELMNYLKHSNLLIGCYTNSIRKTASMMLENIGVFNYLDIFVTNQDVKKPKPDPEGYNLCCSILKIDKQDTLIIEDSEKGFLAASAANIDFIKVKNATEVNINLFRSYYENIDTNGWRGK